MARISEGKDCSQNATALRPYLDIGMIERSWHYSQTTIRIGNLILGLGSVKLIFSLWYTNLMLGTLFLI
jgi:hypothetical protein